VCLGGQRLLKERSVVPGAIWTVDIGLNSSALRGVQSKSFISLLSIQQYSVYSRTLHMFVYNLLITKGIVLHTKVISIHEAFTMIINHRSKVLYIYNRQHKQSNFYINISNHEPAFYRNNIQCVLLVLQGEFRPSLLLVILYHIIVLITVHVLFIYKYVQTLLSSNQGGFMGIRDKLILKYKYIKRKLLGLLNLSDT
jgi:hypothetical protein